MTKPDVKYEISHHHGHEVIFIRFEYNQELNARIRTLVGVEWSNSQIC